MTVTIMKKTKKLKTRVGIFKNMGGSFLGGNFPVGNFPGGSLMGGNFPGGNFPDTVCHNILLEVNFYKKCQLFLF